MNANDSLERRITDYYEREAPGRAPDWVLGTALETIDTTPQRRVLVPAPWRFRHMNSFAKLAIAAVVVIAVGVVGWNMFAPRSSTGVGGQASPSPSVSPSPSPTFGATVIPEPAPPLTERFTSERHGFSMSYPNGWDTRAATAPWTTGFPNFDEPAGDVMYDPILRDHLFISVVSRPLGSTDATQWIADGMAVLNDSGECPSPVESVTVTGGTGQMCGASAALVGGDRGYVIVLYTSGDDPPAVAAYDEAFFREVLTTMQLSPADAVDTPASPSASPSS